MELSIEPTRLKAAHDAVESLSRFSAFLNVHLSPTSLTVYTINSTLSSYASVVFTSDYFDAMTTIDAALFATSFKVSASTLLLLFKSKRLTSNMQLIFSSNNIVAILKQQQFTEKIYKFPFEQVDFINAGHPDLLEYPMAISILTRNLWQSIIPHTIWSSKLNELLFNFTSDSLQLRSRDEASYSSTTTVPRKEFYEYAVKQGRSCSFTLIKSEFIGLVSGAEQYESLIKVYFGIDGAPILITISGCGDGVSMSCIMSAMTEHSAVPPEEPLVIVESDEDVLVDDEFTIPGTPEYVY